MKIILFLLLLLVNTTSLYSKQINDVNEGSGLYRGALQFMNYIGSTPGLNYIYGKIDTQVPNKSLISRTKVIAHRGVPGPGYIENTMAAYVKSEEVGIAGIEIDVHLTKDNQLVLSHDRNLLRVFGKNINVTEKTESELRRLAPQVPFLKDVFKKFKKSSLIFGIELKKEKSKERDNKLIKLLAEMIVNEDLESRTFIMSFEENRLIRFKEQNSFVPVILITTVSPRRDLKIVKEYNLNGIFGHFVIMSKSFINDHISPNGFIVGIGVVNSINLAKREMSKGVDYLFTDIGEEIIKDLVTP